MRSAEKNFQQNFTRLFILQNKKKSKIWASLNIENIKQFRLPEK